jgi:hypothetical protein
MKKNNYFKNIFQSFFSTNLYVNVATKQQKSIGFVYLIILITICWIPVIIKTQVQLSTFVNQELPLVAQQFPTIEIKNGVVNFDKESPIIIKDEKTGDAVFIFDNTGEYTSLSNTSAKLLLTANKLIYKQSSIENREYDLSSISNFTLSPEKILRWAKLLNYTFILMFIGIIPLAFVYRMFVALLFTLIALLLQAILKTQLSFQSLYRSTIYCITPAYIVDKLFMLFEVSFPGWSIIYFIIVTSFILFALLAVKNDAEQTSTNLNLEQ